MEKESNPRARNWVFTINNFTEEDIEQVNRLKKECKAIIAEKEHCNGEGTPHIQGYVSFNERIYRNQLSRWLPRAYLEIAKGGWKENWRYCSKERNVFIEEGHKLTDYQCKGSVDFQTMYEDMKRMTPAEFEDTYPKFWVMHRDKVMSVMIQHAMSKVRDFEGDLPEKNWWIWGVAGVGKSRWAASNGTYNEIFKKNFNKWWDGYDLLSTKFVILEDYPCVPQGNVLVQHMKIWGDRYPFEAECKGSHLMVEPRRFFLIVTSNYPIERCFENEEDILAIKRRFHQVEMIQGDLLSMGDFTLDRKIIEEE